MFVDHACLKWLSRHDFNLSDTTEGETNPLVQAKGFWETELRLQVVNYTTRGPQ